MLHVRTVFMTINICIKWKAAQRKKEEHTNVTLSRELQFDDDDESK